MSAPAEPRPDRALSRRGVLTGALAAGAVATLARVPGAAATEPGDASKTVKRPAATFFAEPALNFQMLFVLSASGYGASETGEVLQTFDRIHGKSDRYVAVYEEFLRLGRQLAGQAAELRKRGRRESARASYLRAAMYLDQALYFVLASKAPTRRHEGTVYREMEASWAAAGALAEPAFESLQIPWSGGHLPAWFLPAPGPGRKPTVIVNTGSDAQNVDMWVYGGAAALERGWNALIFEGPGQGANLFLRSEPFIPDWERVITPLVDYLRGRREVERGRISLVGQSFGGYLAPRAASREHRLAGLVADPGVTDAFYSWRTSLPKSLLQLLAAGKRDEFNHIWDEIPSQLSTNEAFGIEKRSEIYGNGGGYEKLKLAQQFVLSRADAQRITCPTAVFSPQLEQFFPGQSQTLHKWIKGSELVPFTIAEGAEYHCEPMAPQLRNERAFDFLETHAH